MPLQAERQDSVLIAVVGGNDENRTTLIDLVSGSKLRTQVEALHVIQRFSPGVSGVAKVEISRIFEQHGQHIGLASLSTDGMTSYGTDLETTPAVQLDSLITDCLRTIDIVLRETYGHGRKLSGVICMSSINEDPATIRNSLAAIQKSFDHLTWGNLAILVVGQPNQTSSQEVDIQRLREELVKSSLDTESDALTILAFDQDSTRESMLVSLYQYFRLAVLDSDVYMRSIIARLLASQLVHDEPHAIALQRCLHSPHPYREFIRLCASSSPDIVEGLSDLVLCAMQNFHDDAICRQAFDEGKFATRILMKVSQKIGAVPSILFVHDISFVDDSIVGMGGNADVFRATKGGCDVVLKRLRKSVFQVGGNEWRKTFFREALLWRQLRHENILELIGLDERTFNGCICMVSPWMVNRDLASYLADSKSLEITVKMIWIRGIVSGLGYLHEQGIVHGDFRGANILLNDALQVRIADFGLSILVDAGMSTMGVTTMREGAVRWMAQEVIDSGHCATEGDIYSLGCVFLEIFSEAPPFPQLRNDRQVISWIIQGKRPSWQTKSKDVSMTETEIEAFAKRCWTGEPSGRPRIESLNLGHGESPQVGLSVFNVGPFPSPSPTRGAPQQMQPLEPVAPLEMSTNRWIPMSRSKKDRGGTGTKDSPGMVDRKVRALLNKLTMRRFDSISDQIIAWANKSAKERDGRTLIQVIRLVFEKATDEAMWSEMYARLCRKMMERISPKVQDEGVRDADGNPIAGGPLFRKYLLNRCQEDFERGWATKEGIAVASKTDEERAAKAAAEIEEAVLYSDEYYAVQKAKRQGLGLVKFIVELFKLRMLTERIMHECVKRLLGNVNDPKEEDIESLCKLLTTVGALLDTPKAHAHMDVYFLRMKQQLMKHPNVTPRLQFMLQDVIELRERKWASRYQAAAPARKPEGEEKQGPRTAAQVREWGVNTNIVLLGSSGVGKTSLLHRYTQDKFESNTTCTTGTSFVTKRVYADGIQVQLQLWDIAGAERFRSLAPMYYRSASAVLILYDITSASSFEGVRGWLEELKRNCSPDLIIYVVGAKADLLQQRQVTLDFARLSLHNWFPPPKPSPPPTPPPSSIFSYIRPLFTSFTREGAPRQRADTTTIISLPVPFFGSHPAAGADRWIQSRKHDSSSNSPHEDEEVDDVDGNRQGLERGMELFEVSAKDAQGLDQLFDALVIAIVKRKNAIEENIP